MSDYQVELSEMRTRITFQQPTMVSGTDKAQVPTYATITTVPTVWARWVNDHGQESVESDARKFVQRAKVTIRYRSDVLTSWQILKGGVAWKILSIDHVRDQRKWLELHVELVKGTA